MDVEDALERLEDEASRLMIGHSASERLPTLAAEALAAGVDSPALRAAAAVNSRDVRDARDLFLEALSELGIAASDEQSAAWRLARHTCGKIVNSNLDPYEGVLQIWSELSDHMVDTGDLRIFTHL